MKVFITGASSGVGETLSRQLVEAGYMVWGVARREDLLKKLQSDLGVDKFLFTRCDVGDENDVEHVVKMMRVAGFIPDVVVLNAAVFHSDTPQYQHSLFKRAIVVNVFGSLIWVDKFLPDFLKRGFGSFITISSISAYLPNKSLISYSTSKVALSATFRNLHMRYKKDNVDFSVVYFGPIATSLVPKWINFVGKPKYFFVLSSQKAAAYIKKIIESKNRKVAYWPPFLIGILFRILLIIPDRFLIFLSSKLKP